MTPVFVVTPSDVLAIVVLGVLAVALGFAGGTAAWYWLKDKFRGRP